jgi:AcrR family transcriptional regulator
MTRSYDMTTRSRKEAETTTRILAATEHLLTEQSLEHVNLGNIAKRAGTTVQTVLRHMGSRDGCLEAVAREVSGRIARQRGMTSPGNIDDAIADLTEHYENDGRLILNLLTQEHSGDSFASAAIRKGRSFHRSWVQRCFAPYLHDRDAVTVDALLSATDLYVWKLLRLDLRRSRKSVRTIITTMVKRILEIS